MTKHFVDLTAIAFKILDEYQKAVGSTLEVASYPLELRNKILEDLYVRDDVFLSLNRPYRRDTIAFGDFIHQCKLHSSLKDMFPGFKDKNLYAHQAQAIKSILAGQTTIISTGTGSGKTESFLIPLLDYCLKNQGTLGIKAIILYPMNALAGDQLRRIHELVQKPGITVGCFIGSTSSEERAKMIRKPPDILITNYVMLDRLITKKNTHSMFERSQQTLRFLVVDEIHYYRGTKGANLCMLLRRLRTLCAIKNQLIQIGASATLRQGGGYYSDDAEEQILSYARSLFGHEAAKHFEFITAFYNDEQTENLDVDPLPTTDQISDEALILEIDEGAVRKLAESLAGKPLPRPRIERESNDSLYVFAQRNQFVQAVRNELRKRACTLNDLIELFTLLYRNNFIQEPHNAEKMVDAYLSIINHLNGRYSSRFVPEILLDYRLHLILSDLGGCLTRCLYCGRYHDGLRTHCTSCNGLLFNVSKKRPSFCISRCDGVRLWPDIQSHTADTRHASTVLVQPMLEYELAQMLVQPRRNKSEVYGILRKGDEEKGDREYAPSSSHPFDHE